MTDNEKLNKCRELLDSLSLDSLSNVLMNGNGDFYDVNNNYMENFYVLKKLKQLQEFVSKIGYVVK